MQKTIFLYIGRTYEQESALVFQKPHQHANYDIYLLSNQIPALSDVA